MSTTLARILYGHTPQIHSKGQRYSLDINISVKPPMPLLGLRQHMEACQSPLDTPP
ncbi:hypothetical protein glysoja_036697 [Glycine soja]|uniref:Uncharacterized protein n=1 Tax=Glycine soja TaxID=3848 RepID=A0A0B2SNC6_GLYSO|nr:hypothetical protein JHK87_024451 [Glycine soja]KHN48141.1 hypothetical protein glysoja_036697 [Glycine soja]